MQTGEFARNTSLLWEISGNGLTKPSYLFGTVHLIDKKDFHVRP
ncbi:MAG: TraB/GumN family protein, partial [Chitinophagales bacterium]|nr:TraB/GumN family protein [Chitinophagales bacterium]